MDCEDIDYLAYLIKDAKKNGSPKPIVLLGAGASKSAGIPDANEIAKQILDKYSDNPKIKNSKEEDKNYAYLMGTLTTNQRNSFLKELIDQAKINVTHIYLAQMMAEGYIDYFLTVNFDNLMQRALALFNIFPPTYDLSILTNITTTLFHTQSITYLHGQHTGVWMLNTQNEMEKNAQVVLPILHQIKTNRTWIVIGYSGNDPIFNHIADLGSFNNNLYWVCYKDNNPSEKVTNNLIERSNSNSFLIKGYDSDSFCLKLSTLLDNPQPPIFNQPFSFLKEVQNNIVDIENDDTYKNVRERLDESKKMVDDAIKRYEKGAGFDMEMSSEQINESNLKKQIIDAIIKKDYSDIEILLPQINSSNKEINLLLSGLYNNWGVDLLKKIKPNSADRDAYEIIFGKYRKSIQLNNENSSAYYNWGNSLRQLADLMPQEEKRKYFELSIEKYEKAISLNDKDASAYNNLGGVLRKLANLIPQDERRRYVELSIEKYEKAINLNDKLISAYNNLGIAIQDLVDLVPQEEKRKYVELSIEKIEKAVSLNDKNDLTYNAWGTALRKLADLVSEEEKRGCLELSIEKYEKAVSLNDKDGSAYHNWGNALRKLADLVPEAEARRNLELSIEKYEKAIVLNGEDELAYHNCGGALRKLADLASEEEKKKYLELSIEKYEKAVSLNDKYDASYNNWGAALQKLSDLVTEEERKKYVELSIEKYEKAITLNDENDTYYCNYGAALQKLADLLPQEEKRKCLELSTEKLEKATSVNDKNDLAYNIWGVVLRDLADLVPREEKKKYLELGIEKYEAAIKLNDKNDSAFNNWGIALQDLSDLASGDEKRKYLELSIEKHEKAIEMDISNERHIDNYIATLGAFSKILLGTEKGRYLEKALKLSINLIESGYGNYYNLACVYALLENKLEALKNLETSLSNQYINKAHVLQDSDWQDYWKDKDFLEIMDKY